MKQIIILIISLINLISCNSQVSKTISNFEKLNLIQNEIENNSTNEKTYKSLDSLKNVTDGADAELYIEIYKNAIIYDTEELLKFLNNNNKKIDENVVIFFRQDKNIYNLINEKLNRKIKKSFIYDSDGYTNLRREKNTDSKIITTINTGEEIDIIDNTDKWFLVETKEGKLGYVHNSRIRYKNGNESISGKWNANSECKNPIGIEIMKNEELIICVEPNQYYIHLSKVNSNDNIISYRLKSIKGPVGEDVFSEAYINDSTVVTLERKDNFKIKLNWLGYYNKINGERQYSEALISNQNPVILYKCDK